MNLPKEINVTKVVNYDTHRVIEEMCDPDNGWINGLTQATPTREDITTQMILDYLQGWIEEDFPYSDNLIIQDENGNVL